MIDFPTSSDQFYILRDDRTDRCGVERAYQKTHCLVCVDHNTAATMSGQVLLFTACNLLSRWCRRVTIVMPTIQSHPDLKLGYDDLGEFILGQMRDADPFGDFRVQASPPDSADIALHIGGNTRNTNAIRHVFVSASGWYAQISSSQPVSIAETTDSNCLGAIAAACLGVAQIFKITVGTLETLLIQDGIFDLFRLGWTDKQELLPSQPWPRDTHIANILMVGAGSVGSAAAYCLRLASLRCGLTVVDKDVTKVENFSRSPVFGRSSFGLNKAEVVARYLSGSPITATPIPQWWDEYIKQQERAALYFDVWLPLANEHGVRWSMQNNIPPLMIHASTSANWGVNHGRHIPGRDDCLIDRFPSRIEADHLMCATGQVGSGESAVDAALPFCSLFAGLLVVADLVRAQLSGYPQVPNFALLDFNSQLDVIQRWDRRPNAQCVCAGQHRRIHEKFNSSTKYWPHFF